MKYIFIFLLMSFGINMFSQGINPNGHVVGSINTVFITSGDTSAFMFDRDTAKLANGIRASISNGSVVGGTYNMFLPLGTWTADSISLGNLGFRLSASSKGSLAFLQCRTTGTPSIRALSVIVNRNVGGVITNEHSTPSVTTPYTDLNTSVTAIQDYYNISVYRISDVATGEIWDATFSVDNVGNGSLTICYTVPQ